MENTHNVVATMVLNQIKMVFFVNQKLLNKKPNNSKKIINLQILKKILPNHRNSKIIPILHNSLHLQRQIFLKIATV